jgi:hypothetical protein
MSVPPGLRRLRTASVMGEKLPGAARCIALKALEIPFSYDYLPQLMNFLVYVIGLTGFWHG